MWLCSFCSVRCFPQTSSVSSARRKGVYRCSLKELAQYLCVVSFSKLLGRLTIDNAPNGHFCSDNTAGKPGVNHQVMNVIVLARSILKIQLNCLRLKSWSRWWCSRVLTEHTEMSLQVLLPWCRCRSQYTETLRSRRSWTVESPQYIASL